MRKIDVIGAHRIQEGGRREHDQKNTIKHEKKKKVEEPQISKAKMELTPIALESNTITDQ